MKGNEWWVEAKATGSKSIAQVDARSNGGTWQPLALKSWGAWAASFHVTPGSHVQLRAKATDGSYGFVPNGWTWTAATPYPSAASTFDARFENMKGNANWVQVNVYASANWGLQGVSFRVDGGASAGTVAKVEGMDTGGPWVALPKQSWGAYAASFHIEPG
ncbi:MAG: hypothetical protein LC623_09410, partial [Halobacteriales archaeon]|nr:hypothetical protein [Halobacteriales archaeon]